ncbi:sorting nexin-29-like [Drosophila teissieri]|uniref:sorting nexin-29-like n=1 Tax=Drosophila teissieri TaxID=7243 RepID=UPI001CBA26C9|nr:sorting nexin-29-like [Drosophila teissieri]
MPENASSSMPTEAGFRSMRSQLAGSTFGQRREDIFRRIQESAHQISQKFSGKELATERDESVQELCESFEDLMSYGMRQSASTSSFSASSFIQNMQEMVSGNAGGGSNNNDATFWEFCQTHLTPHERQRYMDLKQIWTNVGRGRAFIRATLNEKRLHSHVLTWLSDEEQLHRFYTPWSLLLNDEAAKKLPEIIDSLRDVLFALNVDATEFNAPRRSTSSVPAKEEPIIFTTSPVPVVGRQKRPGIAVERPIECASSTEDLLGALKPIESVEVLQLLSKESIEQELAKPQEEVNLGPFDPIEPELEFLKTPLPEFGAHVGEPELYEDRSDTSSQWSKSSSSANCVANNQQQAVLEEHVNQLNERCALLETRVAELSLQNRLLIRRLTKQFEETGIDPSSSLCSNFLITIPHVKLAKTHRSGSHYTYEVHITMRQRLEHWTFFRRYSEFNKLHKSLLKTHPVVGAVEFPPKKHFGNMNLVFVEERRQQLQIYLLNLVETLPQVEACKSKAELQKVFPFFRDR